MSPHNLWIWRERKKYIERLVPFLTHKKILIIYRYGSFIDYTQVATIELNQLLQRGRKREKKTVAKWYCSYINHLTRRDKIPWQEIWVRKVCSVCIVFAMRGTLLYANFVVIPTSSVSCINIFYITLSNRSIQIGLFSRIFSLSPQKFDNNIWIDFQPKYLKRKIKKRLQNIDVLKELNLSKMG